MCFVLVSFPLFIFFWVCFGLFLLFCFNFFWVSLRMVYLHAHCFFFLIFFVCILLVFKNILMAYFCFGGCCVGLIYNILFYFITL